MTCTARASSHDGLRPRMYWTGLGVQRMQRVLCEGCVRGLNSIGMDWREERRVADVPVSFDRRGWRPGWLARLQGRDETGRLVA